MGKLGGTASIEIDAPIDEVWAVLEDVPSHSEWQGFLDESEALERDEQGRGTLLRFVGDIKVRKVVTINRFSYEPKTAVRWTQEKGDIKSLKGSWELRDLGDGRTHVTFTLDGDPGRVLGMLLRGPVEATVRNILVGNRPQELADYMASGR
jgi:ribosome-associated toxin RatA of RatAB toxin-antitoxin module